jgi:hypothetical protein
VTDSEQIRNLLRPCLPGECPCGPTWQKSTIVTYHIRVETYPKASIRFETTLQYVYFPIRLILLIRKIHVMFQKSQIQYVLNMPILRIYIGPDTYQTILSLSLYIYIYIYFFDRLTVPTFEGCYRKKSLVIKPVAFMCWTCTDLLI